MASAWHSSAPSPSSSMRRRSTPPPLLQDHVCQLSFVSPHQLTYQTPSSLLQQRLPLLSITLPLPIPINTLRPFLFTRLPKFPVPRLSFAENQCFPTCRHHLVHPLHLLLPISLTALRHRLDSLRSPLRARSKTQA